MILGLVFFKITAFIVVRNIDDIHIYNRAINSDEVKALYDGNITQTITITSNNSVPCGGDNIEFTANGGSLTSKY